MSCCCCRSRRRRYRFFDVYRARVRQIERYYFAQIFSPQPDFASNWLVILGESLRAPQFLLSHRVAFARRLRRNYLYMFLILLLAWVLKISTPSLQPEGVSIGFVRSLTEAVGNAALGPVPGWLVVAIIAISYAALLAAAFLTVDDEGELAHGASMCDAARRWPLWRRRLLDDDQTSDTRHRRYWIAASAWPRRTSASGICSSCPRLSDVLLQRRILKAMTTSPRSRVFSLKSRQIGGTFVADELEGKLMQARIVSDDKERMDVRCRFL